MAPKVTVCIFAYNLEKYISKAIESVLMQRTEFPFELLIAEDRSTDATRVICESYRDNYPEKVRLLLREENLGMIRNVFDTLKTINSEFVAILDGDDYWIDPLKLQMQYDFMTEYPDFSLCCHNSIVLHEDHEIAPYLFNPRNQNEILSLNDIIEKWSMATATMFYRNSIMEFPDWIFKAHNFDLAIQIILAHKGKVKYMPEPMAVYRKTMASNSFNPNYPQDYVYYRMIDLLTSVNDFYGLKYNAQISKRILELKRLIRSITLSKKFPFLKFLKIKRIFRYLGRE